MSKLVKVMKDGMLVFAWQARLGWARPGTAGQGLVCRGEAGEVCAVRKGGIL